MNTRPWDGLEGRVLIGSLAVSGVLVALALAGLALQGNWPKVARVLLAWLTYGVLLLGSVRGGRNRVVPGDRLPFWMFGLAGAGAGVVSGLMQPTRSAGLVVLSGLLTATLVGGLHFLVVRGWRGLTGRITGGRCREGSEESLGCAARRGRRPRPGT
jgi:hypothetical protein